jgi:hypothetical protein
MIRAHVGTLSGENNALLLSPYASQSAISHTVLLALGKPLGHNFNQDYKSDSLSEALW